MKERLIYLRALIEYELEELVNYYDHKELVLSMYLLVAAAAMFMFWPVFSKRRKYFYVM